MGYNSIKLSQSLTTDIHPLAHQKGQVMRCLFLLWSVIHVYSSLDITTMHIDGLVQDCNISIASSLEILQSCTKPSFVVAEGTVGCHGDNLRCHRGIWGRWLCGLRFSLVFSARLIWHLFPIYRDSHVTEMQTMLCIMVLLSLKKNCYYRINSLLNMKAGDRHFDDFGVAGGTMSCPYDNLRCHRWRRACRSDGPLFSMLDVPVLDALLCFKPK